MSNYILKDRGIKILSFTAVSALLVAFNLPTGHVKLGGYTRRVPPTDL